MDVTFADREKFGTTSRGNSKTNEGGFRSRTFFGKSTASTKQRSETFNLGEAQNWLIKEKADFLETLGCFQDESEPFPASKYSAKKMSPIIWWTTLEKSQNDVPKPFCNLPKRLLKC